MAKGVEELANNKVNRLYRMRKFYRSFYIVRIFCFANDSINKIIKQILVYKISVHKLVRF